MATRSIATAQLSHLALVTFDIRVRGFAGLRERRRAVFGQLLLVGAHAGTKAVATYFMLAAERYVVVLAGFFSPPHSQQGL